MKIAQFPNSSASRYWRLEDPGVYLKKRGHEVEVFTTTPTKEMCEYFDIFVTQGMVDKDSIALLYEYQQEHGKKIVVDQDDDLIVDPSNPHLKDHEVTDAVNIVQKTIEIADMVTTTTQYLARKLSQYQKNVMVFPNNMDMKRWDLPKHKNSSKRVRIGWAGSITHIEDLKMILPVLHRIQKEYPEVLYVFVGDMRIKEHLEGLEAEIMLGVPFEAWPAKLHSLSLDISIAPLVVNDFNKCKSNIKALEYGIAQYPGVYSKIIYGEHMFDGYRGITAENEEQWYLGIRNLIVCPPLRENLMYGGYAHSSQWHNLEKEVHLLEEAYMSLTTPTN